VHSATILTGVKVINETEFSKFVQFWVRNHEHFSVLNNSIKHRQISLTHNDLSKLDHMTNQSINQLITQFLNAFLLFICIYYWWCSGAGRRTCDQQVASDRLC